jgi:hypothetical protein
MRFMLLLKGSEDSEAGVLPTKDRINELAKYHDALVKAGILLAADALHASFTGARVTFAGEKRTVTDGPFPRARDLVAGFWMIQAKSKEEAIEWAKRCPNLRDGKEAEIEVRQMFDASDLTPELLASEDGRALLELELALRERTNPRA